MGVTQYRLRHHVGQYQGHETGEQSEDDKATGVFLHPLHVHLESSEEHDVVETHAAEEFERVVALQDVEAILSDDDTRQYHTDDVRNTQFTHHNWR